MDLIEILRHRIDALPPGDHVAGLRAVLQHIVVAANHLERGQKSGDDTAFTDAIYRSNQAFEGSLKEAYRVLAEKDPAQTRPFDIETYLQDHKLLRRRVLAQFSNYRQEWRNPAAHDYRLDFDEDEALLAIVSVSAFAVVLIDQISEKFSFAKARATAVVSRPINVAIALADQIAEALRVFRWQRPAEIEPPRESDLIGAIAGHLSAVLVDAVVETDLPLGADTQDRLDVVVSHLDQKVIIEVKRSLVAFMVFRQAGLAQLKRYMELAGTNQGVLYTYRSGLEMECETITEDGNRIIIVGPTRALGFKFPLVGQLPPEHA